MKECDNSKIHISSNFILSISLLILFDTLLLRPSLHCNTPLHFTRLHHTLPNYTSLHFTTLYPTTLHYTYRHFTSSHLHFTTLSFSFAHLNFLSFYLTLRRLMSYIYIYIYIYIYMEHPFLMFLDHTQRRSTVGRTPLDE